MSNVLAIATVTATLQQLLLTHATSGLPGASVRIGQPKKEELMTPSPEINICLYQVSRNAGYSTFDLATRDSTGKLLQPPRIGLNLHYLLSFYGEEQQLVTQRLLSNTMLALHSYPLLARDQILSTINQPLYSYLGSSNLGDAPELVKFCFDNQEIINQLWRNLFFDIPYTLSVCYVASVVVMEGEETPLPVPIVQERNIFGDLIKSSDPTY